MLNQVAVLSALLFTSPVVVAARAQAATAQDTEAIELATAQYIRPTVGASMALDSRDGFAWPTVPRAERTNAPLLAKMLGVPLVHREDVLDCGTSCKGSVRRVWAIERPQIHGDSATITVEWQNNTNGKPRAQIGGQEYVLARTPSGWRVVRLGRMSIS